jgi:hypothetical protein
MEERPPIWRVGTNVLNKQSRTADKGWSSSLGVGRGVENSSLKTYQVPKLELLHRTWTDTVVRPEQRERDTRFGTWNDRSLYRAGSLTAATKELLRCIFRSGVWGYGLDRADSG